MDLKQLRYFVSIAELGSFTRASAHLRITQPALSRQMARLAAEMKVPLLRRDGRNIALTAAGEVLLERARFLLRQAEQTRADVSELAEAPGGQVAIALPPTVSKILLAPLIRAATERYPTVSIRVMEGFDSAQIEDWLTGGRADLGIYYQHKANPKIESRVLLEEELLVIGPPGAKHAKALAATELRRLPLVLPARPHGLRMYLDSLLGMKLHVLVESNALTPLLELVKAGIGYTVLPDSAVHEELAQGTLTGFRIARQSLARDIVVGVARDHPRTQAERRIHDLVNACIADLHASGTWRARKPGRAAAA